MQKLLVVLVALSLVACAGDTGPTGPAGATGAMGPAGPQGPPGLDGTSASISFGIVTIDAFGEAVLIALNAQVETSVINCYTSSSAAGPWQAVADGFSISGSSFCAATNVGTDLVITLLRGIPGWFFLATMVTVP